MINIILFILIAISAAYFILFKYIKIISHGDVIGRPLAYSMFIYILIAYIIKLWIIYILDENLLIELNLLPSHLSDDGYLKLSSIANTYTISVIISCILFINLRKIFKISHTSNARQINNIETLSQLNKNYYLAFTIILILKWIVNIRLGWGVPATVPANSIPLLTGLLVIIVRDGALLFSYLAIYEVFNFRLNTRQKLTRILLILIFLALDSAIGSKFGLIGLMIGLAVTLSRRALLIKGRNKIYLILIFLLFIILFIPIYQFLNIFRFVRLDTNLDYYQTFITVLDKTDIAISVSIAAIFSRVTGLEGLIQIIMYGDGLKFNFFDYLVESDFSKNYTYLSSGLDSTDMGVGASLSAVNYIFSDRTLIFYSLTTIICTLILMFSLAIVGNFVSGRRKDELFAYTCFSSLILIHMQMASGNLLHHFKQLIPMIIFFSLFRLFRSHLYKNSIVYCEASSDVGA